MILLSVYALQSYGVSLAVWDHTVLPDIPHKSRLQFETANKLYNGADHSYSRQQSAYILYVVRSTIGYLSNS